MKKLLALGALTLLGSALSMAQESSEVRLKNLEKWWGVSTAYCSEQPFVEVAQSTEVSPMEISSPLMISNLGRYIILDENSTWSFDNSAFYFDSPNKISAVDTKRSLREAYIVAVNRGIKDHTMGMPAEIFFNSVVYNYSGAVDKLLDITEHLTPGVIVLSEGWQSDYGALDFNDDPTEILRELHSRGFKVVINVGSYVSPDSPYFRDYRERGYLECDQESNPKIVEWQSGFSARLNLRDSTVLSFVEGKLTELRERYSVDGFNVSDEVLSLKNGYSMVRGSKGGCGITKDVQEITLLRGCTWNSISGIVPKITMAGLLSYPYITFNMNQIGTKCDEELFMRALQIMIMTPVMQLDLQSYNALSKENRKVADRLIQLRNEEIAPYITKLAVEASKSGEPIVRTMEYNYSAEGFWDCNDQFMVGTEYIVTPITTKNSTKRLVRLPRGRWVDDQGRVTRGPAVLEIDVKSDRLPYFKRK